MPAPSELADKIRQQGTARFRYGWAWGDPKIPVDGLRGVGVTDFSRGLTRIVGVPIPARSLQQMRAVPARRPLSRLFFRLMARKLRDQAPAEHRIGEEEPESAQPHNPLWPLLLLDRPLGVAVPDGSEIELQVDLTGARDLLPSGLTGKRPAPLRISLGDDGVPRRVGISPEASKLSPETWWHVVEFAEFGVNCDGVDLWAEWERVRVP